MKSWYTYLPYLSTQDIDRAFFTITAAPDGSHPFCPVEGSFCFSTVRSVPASSKVPAWLVATWHPG